MTTHAPLSGSTAHIWTECPGAFYLWQDPRLKGEEVDKSAAEFGTTSHELNSLLVADFIDHKLHGTDPLIRFELIKGTYPEEMHDLARGYLEVVWEKVLEFTVTSKVVGIEDRFDITDNMYGYADFWAIWKDDHADVGAYILDYKSGYGLVEAENNPQLAFYAVALRCHVRSLGKDLDYVKAAIYQPRVGEPVFRETKFTATMLDRWEKKFRKAEHQILVEKKTKLKVGKHCKYCKALSICPAYATTVQSVSSLAVLDSNPVNIKSLTDEQVSKLVLNADMLTNLAKAAKAYAIHRNSQGCPLPGVKVVEGAVKRSWKDNEVEIAKGLANLGCGDIFSAKLKGLGEIERQLKALGHTAEKAKKLIEPYVERGNPSLTVVPIDDPRTEVITINLTKIEENNYEQAI